MITVNVQPHIHLCENCTGNAIPYDYTFRSDGKLDHHLMNHSRTGESETHDHRAALKFPAHQKNAIMCR
jgi:hypothetical protein